LRHREVADHGVERARLELGQRRRSAVGERSVPRKAPDANGPRQRAQDARLVIDEEDAQVHDAALTSCAAAALSGILTWNTVPRPGTESNVSVPACFSTTMLRAMARPCPVPCPKGLVVKNGSKMRTRTGPRVPPSVAPLSPTTPSPSAR